MSLRNPICNEGERQEMFELIRKRARKETGTALHFGNEVKREDVLFGAIEEAYFYIFNKKDIPFSCSPEYMLSYIIEEVGEENVTVLEKAENAIKIKLKNHIWWLCRGLFSAYESQMPWQVSHIGVNENASISFPRPIFPVCMEFEKIIPILDELFPQIEDVAMAAARDKQNRVKQFKKTSNQRREKEESNRVFSVTVTIDQNWKKPHYPRYRVSHMNIGTATSLQGAEELIHKIVSKDESVKYFMQIKNIHHFNVREIPADELCMADECLSEWLYDKEGNLVDSRLISNMRNLPGLFSGRTEEQYRFHEGDIVEVETFDEISLAFVVAVPPSIERALKINTGTHFHLDDTDDCYVVLTDSDYGSHDHVATLRLFQPQHRIHPSIEKRLRNAYAEYLTSEMREKIALTTAKEKMQQIAEELGLECEIKPYFYEWINFILKDFPGQGHDTHIQIANKLAYEHIDRIRTTLLRLVGKPVSGRGYSLKEVNPAQPEVGARYYAISTKKM